MRWKSKFEIGDVRVKKKFAFLPFKGCNETVWLEFVFIKQKFSAIVVTDVFGQKYLHQKWCNLEFATKEEYLK